MAYKLTEIVSELFADRIATKVLAALTGGTSGVDSVAVTAGGTGYLSAPTVVFTPTSGGSGAAGTAVLSGTAVVAIVMTAAGTGYVTAPTVVFTPTSGGSGASGTALLRALCLDAIRTTTRSVGMSVISPVGGTQYLHTLLAGTDAEFSPLIIRPDDYAGGTNEKVWKQLTLSAASLRAEDSNGVCAFLGNVLIAHNTPSATFPGLYLSRSTVHTSGTIVHLGNIGTWTPSGTVSANVSYIGTDSAASLTGSADGSASGVVLMAARSRSSHDGSGAVADVIAHDFLARKTSTGAIATAIGARIQVTASGGTGAITTAYGLQILSPSAASPGITACQGIRVEAQNVANVTSPYGLVLAGSTDRHYVAGFVQHVATTAPGTPVEGDLWNDSTRKGLQAFLSGIKQGLVGCTFTQTATQTIGNTVTETTMFGSGIGSLTLPANFFTVGKTIECELHGHFANGGTPTLRVRFYLGSTLIADTGAITTPTFTGDEHFRIRLIITCRSTGASGSMSVSAECRSHLGASGTGTYFDMEVIPTETTVDTTAAQALNITAEWGTASSGNTIDTHVATVKVLH